MINLIRNNTEFQHVIKIIAGDFNAKIGKEEIFKPVGGNSSLHETSN
jgi:hypothetical protein